MRPLQDYRRASTGPHQDHPGPIANIARIANIDHDHPGARQEHRSSNVGPRLLVGAYRPRLLEGVIRFSPRGGDTLCATTTAGPAQDHTRTTYHLTPRTTLSATLEPRPPKAKGLRLPTTYFTLLPRACRGGPATRAPRARTSGSSTNDPLVHYNLDRFL